MINQIVFDFGAVLVDWNPRYLYRKIFLNDEEAVERFLAETNFFDWNERADRGEKFEDLILEVSEEFPHYRTAAQAFFERFPETLSGPIQGSVAILEKLHALKMPLYGLTNWSAETFSRVKPDFPFFNYFDGIVVSGEEKLAKPDPRIFQVLLERYAIDPQKTLFIDDREVNIRAAEKFGIQGHIFTSPEELHGALEKFGLI